MIRARVAVRTILATAVLVAAFHAGPARALVIEAHVMKGFDRQPVSGQSVTLHVVRGTTTSPPNTRAPSTRKGRSDPAPTASGARI
jgi:hypothetical protein